MAEQFVNLASTELSAGIDADDAVISVVSDVLFPADGTFRINVEGELMLVNRVFGVWNVKRGIEGTTAASHTSGSPVEQVLTVEGLGIATGTRPDVVYGAAGEAGVAGSAGSATPGGNGSSGGGTCGLGSNGGGGSGGSASAGAGGAGGAAGTLATLSYSYEDDSFVGGYFELGDAGDGGNGSNGGDATGGTGGNGGACFDDSTDPENPVGYNGGNGGAGGNATGGDGGVGGAGGDGGSISITNAGKACRIFGSFIAGDGEDGEDPASTGSSATGGTGGNGTDASTGTNGTDGSPGSDDTQSAAAPGNAGNHGGSIDVTVDADSRNCDFLFHLQAGDAGAGNGGMVDVNIDNLECCKVCLYYTVVDAGATPTLQIGNTSTATIGSMLIGWMPGITSNNLTFEASASLMGGYFASNQTHILDANSLGSIWWGGGNQVTNSSFSYVLGNNHDIDNSIYTIAAGYGHVLNSAGSSAVFGSQHTVNNFAGVLVSGEQQEAKYDYERLHGSASTRFREIPHFQQTTNATPFTKDYTLNNNTAIAFRLKVKARSSGGDVKHTVIEGTIKRGANAAATALVGTPTTTDFGTDAGASTWTVGVAANTTQGSLRLTLTGASSTTINWVSFMEIVE